MKLNLGSGTDIRQGYVNVDFRQLPGVDMVVDLSVFPWPFADNSVDEILMHDFLEHFPYRMTQTILLECHRIMVPGGLLYVQVPDGVHTARALIQEGDYLCNRCGGSMYRRARDDGDGSGYPAKNFSECPKCGQTADEIAEAANGRLYGGQDFVGNFHQTCFTPRSLEQKAGSAGFKNVTHLSSTRDDDHYWRNWTIHMALCKADLW